MPTIITRGAASAKAYGFGGGAAKVIGSQSYTTAGTYTWVAPAGVTKVSVVAVGGGANDWYTGGGGGGLGYKNNISVTPGSSYTVVVGAGGTAGTGNFYKSPGQNSYFVNTSTVKGGGACSATGGTYTGDGGGNGGSAVGAGGGAGGYSGAGGCGGASSTCTGESGLSGSGGGGGGGGFGITTCACGWVGGAAGGGVGLFGQGSNGSGGTGHFPNSIPGCGGGGGSGGTSGQNQYSTPTAAANGRSYGGGAGGQGKSGGSYSGAGGGGAIRIVWPGCARLFPSTCVGTP